MKIPAFRLTYHGKGCGGVNLPFSYILDAIAYAKSHYATDFTVYRGNGNSVVASGERRDCRHKWNITFPSYETLDDTELYGPDEREAIIADRIAEDTP
jgi:hypothetical protein